MAITRRTQPYATGKEEVDTDMTQHSRFHMPAPPDVAYTHPETDGITPVPEVTTPGSVAPATLSDAEAYELVRAGLFRAVREAPAYPDGSPLDSCDEFSVTAGDACPNDCTSDPGENTLERHMEDDAIVQCPSCGWRCWE